MERLTLFIKSKSAFIIDLFLFAHRCPPPNQHDQRIHDTAAAAVMDVSNPAPLLMRSSSCMMVSSAMDATIGFTLLALAGK